MTDGGGSIRFLDSAADMLALAGDALERAGARGELSLGILHRLLDEPAAWGDDVLLLAVCSGSTVDAIVTRTGPFPALIVAFGDVGAIDLDAVVQALVDRGDLPSGINGERAASTAFAQAWRRVAAADVGVVHELRTFRLRSVRFPSPAAPGAMRAAEAADDDLMVEWFEAFAAEALGEGETRTDDRRHVTRLRAAGDLVIWAVDGDPVSLAAVNRRAGRWSGIGPVYTPPAARRQGYASALVAALSQRELDAGAEWCSLFTDLANPTSNHIYVEVGYEPQCDFVHHSLSFGG